MEIELENTEELAGLRQGDIERLKIECLKCLEKSYSPYSKFRVGCLVVSSSGKVFKGANIENASYGACICAERTAISTAVAMGHKSLEIIMICGDSDEPVTPCGICRQVIREFGKDSHIFMYNRDGSKHLEASLQQLLPNSFGPEDLGIYPKST